MSGPPPPKKRAKPTESLRDMLTSLDGRVGKLEETVREPLVEAARDAHYVQLHANRQEQEIVDLREEVQRLKGALARERCQRKCWEACARGLYNWWDDIAEYGHYTGTAPWLADWKEEHTDPSDFPFDTDDKTLSGDRPLE